MNHDYLHCTWREWRSDGMHVCQKPATVCTVYGCLNGHLNEFVGCPTHFNVWVDMVADHQEACCIRDCDQDIDSWELTQISNLTSGAALYLKTKQ
jgi:hypothetical protein